MKRLKLKKELCIGCKLCAQVCSAYKEGAYVPTKARIDIESAYEDQNLVFYDNFCILCGLCVKVCPEGAIKSGDYIEVDMDKCTGCGACADKCPKHAVKIRGEKAYICDTCKGDPKCIKICPHQALTFE